jgi:hypothetical protein
MVKTRLFRYILIGLILFLALAPATTAFAQGKPIRTQFPFAAFTVQDACKFDVRWEPLVDKTYLTVFNDKDGPRYIYTGNMKTRMTNLDTGKTVDINIAGKMTEVYDPDGSYKVTISGPFIGWFGFPGNPPLAYIHGQQVLKYDPDGNLIQFNQSGKVTDLCNLLAD